MHSQELARDPPRFVNAEMLPYPKVFISYCHESAEHNARVRSLAASLARDGCDCRVDVHKDTDEDWPTWMTRQLIEADYCICIVTELYDARFRDNEHPTIGLGVGWEAGIIRKLLYLKKLQNRRVLPAPFVKTDVQYIPIELAGFDYFVLNSDSTYMALLRKLHGRVEFEKPTIGMPPDLTSQAVEPLFASPERANNSASPIVAIAQAPVEVSSDVPSRPSDHGRPTNAARDSILTLDRPGHTEDKDFLRAAAIIGRDLVGILGSASFRHGSEVSCIKVSANGGSVLSVGNRHGLKQWELLTGRCLRHVKLSGDGRNWVISDDGRYAAAFNWRGTVTVCSTDNGNEVHVLKHGEDWSGVCDICTNSTSVLGAAHHDLRIWDLNSGSCVMSLQNLPSVSVCVFSYNGRQVIYGYGGYDRKLTVIDIDSGEIVRQIELRRPKSNEWAPLTCATMSPDGQRLLCGTGSTLRMWNLSTGFEIREFKGHSREITTCKFSRDGRLILTGSKDNTLRLWDPSQSGAIVCFTGHTKAVSSCDFCPDSRHVVSGAEDGTIRVWDVSTGSEIVPISGHTLGVSACMFTPNREQLVTASWDGTVRLWNLIDGFETAKIVASANPLLWCDISPDGRHLLFQWEDKSLKVWDLMSNTESATLFRHIDLVTKCEFSRDGTRVLSCGKEGWLKFWDRATGRCLLIIEPERSGREPLYCCALSPDSGRAVSATSKSLKLWSLPDGGEMWCFEGDNQHVNSCVFSPDGRWLMTGSKESLTMWDMASGKEFWRLRAHDGLLRSCVFSANGERVLSCGSDDKVKVWDVQSRELLREWAIGCAVNCVAWREETKGCAVALLIAVGLENGTIMLLNARIQCPPVPVHQDLE